jgi:hypothetical protein
MTTPARTLHSPAARKRPVVVYPETDRMGEHEIRRLIAELLRPMIARYLAERGVVAHAGADTFLYYVEGDPASRRRLSRGLVQVEATHDDRVRSRSLGCWLRAVGTGGEQRVHLAVGSNGDELLATDAEEVDRLRAELQALKR